MAEAKIALFGAGGAVANALAGALTAKQIPFREVGRTKAVRADFYTGEGVREAAQGIETIFYVAGAPYTEFFKHPIMVRNALDAAQAAGVKRFIHVASVYSYGAAQIIPVPETQPHEPHTRKGRFRLEQELEVLGRHSDAFQTVIVHMPSFYGPHADQSYADVFMREALSGKTARWVGPLDVQREFIYTGDMAEPLLALAEDSGAYGRCWNLGGQAVRARDFADEVFKAIGKPPKYRAVPKVMLQALGLFVPFMREVAEMYYEFSSGFVLDDSALRSRIGAYLKTPIDRGVAQTIAWMRA
jgi:nucleoside-diphosphate-sugar epimerase